MDPLQATASRCISPVHNCTAEEIDAFYDDNAFETLHTVRRALGHFARLLRAAPDRFRRRTPAAPEIASAPRRA